MITQKKLNLLFIIIIILSFIIGLIINENSSGGALTDFVYIFGNFKLFLASESVRDIPWENYNSSSLPLYYLVLDVFFSNPLKLNLIITNIILISLSVFFFYLTIKKVVTLKKFEKSYLLLISFILLLSPYTRSSTFWGLEEIIGICNFIITLYFFFEYKNNNKFSYLILTIFFSCMALFSRQSYAFLILFIFFEIIDLKKILIKKNLIIILSYIIFLTPSIYVFNQWGGFLPPIAVEKGRSLSIYFQNIPVILSISLTYLIPFMFLSFNNLREFQNFFIQRIFTLSVSSIFFFIILLNYKFQLVGGGVFIKILNLLNLNFYIKIFMLSIFSSICFVYLFYKLNKKILIFLSLLIIIFLTIDLIFQEYFDPIIFIILIIFFNYKNISAEKFKYFVYISLFYYGFYLLGANLYYKFI